jgi:hypothetical protein
LLSVLCGLRGDLFSCKLKEELVKFVADDSHVVFVVDLKQLCLALALACLLEAAVLEILRRLAEVHEVSLIVVKVLRPEDNLRSGNFLFIEQTDVANWKRAHLQISLETA